MFERVVLLTIRFYQRFISPATPPTCRFYPTCSSYTRDAVVRFGPFRGLWMGMKRIARCHPWHPGGYDPVEELSNRNELENI
ncbi:MAG: membrane protein insertion efficiency factor YidD [Desulfuromonadales bacterium]|jgi:putative membrane protein insertion efficiency factor|nr:membrane protein insertion efficiency factor YidD [Desulfuromonadales bacterium]